MVGDPQYADVRFVAEGKPGTCLIACLVAWLVDRLLGCLVGSLTYRFVSFVVMLMLDVRVLVMLHMSYFGLVWSGLTSPQHELF